MRPWASFSASACPVCSANMTTAPTSRGSRGAAGAGACECLIRWVWGTFCSQEALDLGSGPRLSPDHTSWTCRSVPLGLNFFAHQMGDIESVLATSWERQEVVDVWLPLIKSSKARHGTSLEGAVPLIPGELKARNLAQQVVTSPFFIGLTFCLLPQTSSS